MLLFFDPNITGEQYTLNEEESKHAVRVLRLEEGATLHVVDGRGNLHTCTLTDAHPKHCTVQIEKTELGNGSQTAPLYMAVAPTKSNDRFEWFLEKATEIGITGITPIICEHSERKVVKIERMTRVVVAAMKQSLKAWLPEIGAQAKFKEFVTSAAVQEFNGQKFIAHCENTERTELSAALVTGQSTMIMIGPEGDFSPSEVDIAVQQGFRPISLGQSRLRTETAGVVACHTVNLLNEIK
jgi:16S rRNA (uracil1498-N3)-methyltransferase